MSCLLIKLTLFHATCLADGTAVSHVSWQGVGQRAEGPQIRVSATAANTVQQRCIAMVCCCLVSKAVTSTPVLAAFHKAASHHMMLATLELALKISACGPLTPSGYRMLSCAVVVLPQPRLHRQLRE
jgi:hypothetical protein